MASSGLAYADIIQNDIDAVGDYTISAGGSTTIGYDIKVGDSADPQNTCNASDGSPATVVLAVPAGVTASTTSLTFTSCAKSQPVTFTAAAAGDYPITVARVVDSGAGTYTTTPANFVLKVSAPPPPANTEPTVSVTGVAHNATYEKSQVPMPGCSVTDAEDTNESATAQVSNGAFDALGSHTVTCSYTDGGGITRSATATYTVVRDRDTTAPVITKTITGGTEGLNGWYTGGNVSLDWTVTENESPETLVVNGCDDVTVSTDQAATDYSCSASSEGGAAAEQTVTIKRDGTAPAVSYDGVAAGTAGNNGWYRSDVTVKFTATDALSGPATASQEVTTSGEGSAVTVTSPAFSDAAGNTTAAGDKTSDAFKIDKTAPTTPTFSGGPGASYYFGSDPGAPTCSSSDALSGLDTCAVTGGGSTVGSHTYTATATDKAGNQSTATHTYTVLAWTTKGFYSPVDMGGVWNTVKGGSTVPLKFELFAGTTELTNTSAIDSFSVKGVSCPNASVATDDIELVTTGGTSLRYDTTGGQFIQNWQTPKKPGSCYLVTMKADDGSTISANFMLK